ncbi:DUF7714 family protein [Actinomycetospora sp. CA-101289]|uniref:DUF7714 family protein n=1 Tax=Actinomycetospora sp. CA-101289 TaxID=3239893 RepID=UPI003D98F9D5
MTRAGANRIPGRYRGVAVARYDGAWDEASLRAHFVGLEAYWKTRFLVVRPHDEDAGDVALLAVARDPGDALFSPITAVELLAGPGECAFVHRPEVDTAIPSALAAVAEEVPDARAVVVQGRYEHVNFVVDADPLRVVVREVVPPHPAKLVDQARRVVDVTEDLRPLRLESAVVDLADLARRAPADHYLLPCRGGGSEVPGATVSYLDERPEPADWTLLGCERSRQIHHWFYGHDAPRVDLCPKVDPAAAGPGALLTKCCLQQEELDEGVDTGPDGETTWVSVPWGASLEHVTEALRRLTALAESRGAPPWSPA